MSKQQWLFENPDKFGVVKDYLSYRHPTNLTRWVNENTVEIENGTSVVDKYLKSLGGVRVDPQD